MASHIVAYDLIREGQNYDCIIAKIKAYGTYWHIQGSVWIIVTTQSSVEVRNNLAACLDSNDKLFVGKMTGEAAWRGYDTRVNDWLKSYLK